MPQQPLPGQPGAFNPAQQRSYIDRRPQQNWNDPPVNFHHPQSLSVNTADNAQHITPQPSPTNSVSSSIYQHERTPPKVSDDVQPIVDTLVELLNHCFDNAPHGIKKKLEDVDRKMPQLYEKLRLKQVSPQVIESLLQLSQAIRASDFAGATHVCQHMAGTGKFAEVGQFVLPIKVLLHTAQQLNIRM